MCGDCNCAETNNVYSFAAAKVAAFQPTNNEPALLELQAVEKGPVYLLGGSMNEVEAAALVNAGSFDLAASIGCPSYLKIPDNPGPFTVYAPENSKGFVRIITKSAVR